MGISDSSIHIFLLLYSYLYIYLLSIIISVIDKIILYKDNSAAGALVWTCKFAGQTSLLWEVWCFNQIKMTLLKLQKQEIFYFYDRHQKKVQHQ